VRVSIITGCRVTAQNKAAQLPLAISCVEPGGGNLPRQIAYKGRYKNFPYMISRPKGKNCCENSSFFLCVLPATESF
jgi:hypothetical protein